MLKELLILLLLPAVSEASLKGFWAKLFNKFPTCKAHLLSSEDSKPYLDAFGHITPWTNEHDISVLNQAHLLREQSPEWAHQLPFQESERSLLFWMLTDLESLLTNLKEVNAEKHLKSPRFRPYTYKGTQESLRILNTLYRASEIHYSDLLRATCIFIQGPQMKDSIEQHCNEWIQSSGVATHFPQAFILPTRFRLSPYQLAKLGTQRIYPLRIFSHQISHQERSMLFLSPEDLVGEDVRLLHLREENFSFEWVDPQDTIFVQGLWLNSLRKLENVLVVFQPRTRRLYEYLIAFLLREEAATITSTLEALNQDGSAIRRLYESLGPSGKFSKMNDKKNPYTLEEVASALLNMKNIFGIDLEEGHLKLEMKRETKPD